MNGQDYKEMPIYFLVGMIMVFVCLVIAACCYSKLEEDYISLQEQLNNYEVKVLTVYIEVPLSDYHPDPSAPWSQEDVVYLAKTVKGEAGNCSKLQQSGVIWCVLNRVDSDRFSYDNIKEAVTAPNQFQGYRASNSVDEDIVALVEDVLARWYLEKQFGNSYGRTLPKEYVFFVGDHYRTNYFSITEGSKNYWDWTWGNPYE